MDYTDKRINSSITSYPCYPRHQRFLPFFMLFMLFMFFTVRCRCRSPFNPHAAIVSPHALVAWNPAITSLRMVSRLRLGL